MSSQLSITLALQPPSLHNLPSTSRAREVLVGCTRRGPSSPAASSSFSSTTSTHLAPRSSVSCENKKCSSNSTSQHTNTVTTSQLSISASFSPQSKPSLSLLSSSSPSLQASTSSTVTSDLVDIHNSKSHNEDPEDTSYQGPNSVLWKAYSRVKQTITETQASNALGTMTEYWHSLSAQRIQDRYQQQQYKEIYPSSPTDSQNMKLFTDAVAHGEQFSSLPKSISPVGSSFSTSPQSFLDRTINDNCYGNYKKIAAETLTAKRSASTLSPSSTQLSSFVAHQAVSLTDSDGAASLPELSEAHGSCSEEEAQAQAQVQALNVTQRLNVPSRAKFFLYEDSDLDSDIGPESIVNTPDNVWVNPLLDQKVEEEHLQDGDCEDYDQHDIDDDDEDFFGKKMPIFSSPKHQPRGSDISSFSSRTAHPTYNALMGRRQSLLSDLLLAEKQQKSQQGSFKSTSRCPSASNSDGETAAVHMVANSMSQGYHAAPQQQHHRRESFMERCDINHFNSHNNVSTATDRTVSPLVRTKKVYKNLAELANTTRAPNHSESSASLSVSSPSSSLSSSPKSSPSPKSLLSSPCAAKTTAAKAATTTTKTERPSIVSTNSFSSCILSKSPSVPTNGWTRTQVQVQIQSLVAQSTSTAQRALLNASTTLTDVLFRTAH